MKLIKLFMSLWRYIKFDKGKFIGYAVLAFLGTGSALLYGYLFGISTEALIAHDFDKFLLIFIGYTIYGLLDVLFLEVFRSGLYNKIELNFMKRISKDLYKKALDLPVLAYDEHKVGEIVNRIYTDPQKVIEIMSRIVYSVARVLVAIFILGLSMTISWVLTLELTIVVVIDYFISRRYYPKLKDTQKKISKMSDKYVADANQVLFGIRDVKGLGLKNIMTRYMHNNVDDLYEEQKKNRNFELYYNGAVMAIHITFESIIFITLGYMVIQGDVVMAMFVAYQWYIWRLFDIIRELSQLGSSYQKVIVAMERIDELLNNKLYADDWFGTKKVDEITGNIEFKNVSFAYNSDKEVLNKLSLKIETSKKIAIIGKSGMGKSTIFNILLRFYEPTKGKVLIDGINLTDFDEESLRKHIAIIRQEPYIFNKTIKENFEMIKEDITLEEIKELCQKVYINDYIMTLPEGYDTLIGEGGVNLSGGQKQRLAIARSLAKNAKIMLFDESTSALDNESQAYIKQTIDELAKDHTIIIVAHRLSTIVDADLIFLIDEGKVLASGTHTELLKKNLLYRKLYQPELLELNV